MFVLFDLSQCMYSLTFLNVYTLCFYKPEIQLFGIIYLSEGWPFSPFFIHLKDGPFSLIQRNLSQCFYSLTFLNICTLWPFSILVLFDLSQCLYSLTFLNIMYITVLHCIVLYCTILHCTVLYCSVLFSIVLYCTELYFTIL